MRGERARRFFLGKSQYLQRPREAGASSDNWRWPGRDWSFLIQSSLGRGLPTSGQGCRTVPDRHCPSEERILKEPLNLHILGFQMFSFSLKLSAFGPSYHLEQLKVQLLHFLFKVIRKPARRNRCFGNKACLFFPHPGHGR